MATRTRGGDGAYRRTTANAARDMRAAELHGQGWSFPRIAAELGFASKGHAWDAVHRAFASIPTPGAAEAKRLDLERIDRLIEKNWEALERPHLAHSQGHVIRHFIGIERDEDGIERLDPEGKTIPVFEDVLDDGPIAAHTTVIMRLLERRARMYGYDEPAKSRIEVIGEDVVDAELKRLEAEIASRDRAHTGPA